MGNEVVVLKKTRNWLYTYRFDYDLLLSIAGLPHILKSRPRTRLDLDTMSTSMNWTQRHDLQLEKKDQDQGNCKLPLGSFPFYVKALPCLIYTPQIIGAVLILAVLLTVKRAKLTDTRAVKQNQCQHFRLIGTCSGSPTETFTAEHSRLWPQEILRLHFWNESYQVYPDHYRD
ncbi:hypothetical protein VNO77_22756 [Canavalia gladiata]|uniref:Uncharacterized protein n=1 Tax=Canavalia gladiata TaxID=3824 RepID=A0AAN9L5S5_CANGL